MPDSDKQYKPTSEEAEETPGYFLSRLRKRFRLMRAERIDHDLLKHFAASIASELDIHNSSDSGANENEKHIVDTINRKLSQISTSNSTEVNWSHAYHAEKLLLAILSNDRVKVELSRRIDRLARTDAPFASFYQGALAQIDDPSRTNDIAPEISRRNILVSMVDDVQLFYCRRYIKMRYARSAIYKIGSAFVIAFFIFLFALTWGHWETTEKSSKTAHNTSTSKMELSRK